MDKKTIMIYVEKISGFDVEASQLHAEIKGTLAVEGLKSVRVIHRYEMPGDQMEMLDVVKETILSETNVDQVYDRAPEIGDRVTHIGMAYLPGQYDQRADWASQCIRIITHGKEVEVASSRHVLLEGLLSESEKEKIKRYLINPVDSQEIDFTQGILFDQSGVVAGDVPLVEGFIDNSEEQLEELRKREGLAMSKEDLVCVRDYFQREEKRNPTETEVKVIDTYWSDHCRHTTFLTEITDIDLEGSNQSVQKAYEEYQQVRKEVYAEREKPVTLMDLATINMKYERKRDNLKDLDVSDEINACSIEIDVDVDGKKEPWLLMFKNETHNHPTEIEPFGGAATCLGGAIRDPLSGRSYVYQAMRVSGSGDPTKDVSETLPGKLPQRKIAKESALGFSSYGNQIGLATGQVTEIYHPNYRAKRMEIGAVVGAAPKENVVRKEPMPGDVVLLIGGKTGRDGCGGATGSSKAHDEESIITCGAEVQKGNPPEERKIQRLFRKKEAAQRIKRCNDFGAGGVSVAIGELADGLEIDLDKVPKKYEGLSGTELAISESQERMAVVVAKEDVEVFLKYASEENVEGTAVAVVTEEKRLVMKWRGEKILDLSRAFLDTNGAKQYAQVALEEKGVLAREDHAKAQENKEESVQSVWIRQMKELNTCSQQGLGEMFDSTIGSGTVLMPYGGKYALTPAEGMAAKIPVMNGDTSTCSVMAYGFQPEVFMESPFRGGVYAVLEAMAKMTAMGVDYRNIRFSFQEYFERLHNDPKRWGKPFSALLGAFYAQKHFSLAAIGGKDSMSGSFKDMDVVPTLVAFAVACEDARSILSPELKKTGSKVYLLNLEKDDEGMIDFEMASKSYAWIKKKVDEKKILSAKTTGTGGVAAAISKMAFGNKIGFAFDGEMKRDLLFGLNPGNMLIEVREEWEEEFDGQALVLPLIKCGKTIAEAKIQVNGETMDLEELIEQWESPLKEVYPIKKKHREACREISYEKGPVLAGNVVHKKPKVFIPVFPGTNCEYDTARAFEKAGGRTETLVFNNRNPQSIDESIEKMAKRIDQSNILMIPGGFSAGDEPDGSGKFIATVMRNPHIRDSILNLLENRDGLILGICNGFQALVKLGLLPFGTIKELGKDDPTLTYNHIGRHISKISGVKIISTKSPWLAKSSVGEVQQVALSHGEGRFYANEQILDNLEAQGQIVSRYVDENGRIGEYSPNGSVCAIEGISSPDGRILGKMGHSERRGMHLYKNITGEKDQRIFESGVEYFG